jgi:hypothetical protein
MDEAEINLQVFSVMYIQMTWWPCQFVELHAVCLVWVIEYGDDGSASYVEYCQELCLCMRFEDRTMLFILAHMSLFPL